MNLKQISSKLEQLHPIDITMLSTLYTLSQKSLFTAIVFTILTTIFLYPELSYAIVLWASVLITFLFVRLYFAYLFKKDPQMYSIDIWHKLFRRLAILTGIVVSSLSFIFIPQLDEYHQLFVLASLLGLSAGATTSLAADFRIAIIYISIIMLPLIVSLLIVKTSVSVILAIILILFFASQIGMIFNNHSEQIKIAELKEEKSLLHNLFSEAPLGMFSYDKNLNVLDANKHLHEMFGHETTMVGMNLNSLPDTRPLSIFSNALTQGAQSYLGPYVSVNGNSFWGETRVFPFKSTDDNILGGIVIIEDKTKEYTDKQELESLHEKLQDQIEHNQHLLAENKLFIADMVHQIRTPLSVIMTNSSLIEMKTKEEVSSYIMQINSAINMLSNSYEDLSYIISNDTIEYKPIEINITDFIYQRIDFFEIIAKANNKAILTNIESNIKVTMNDTELERIIDNNLSNAIKHSSDRSEIEIILEKSNSDIVLEFISLGKDIIDTKKIFYKNYTESHGAKRSLGLGLNMVKMICEKNNIQYSAHSGENTNTFTYIFNG